MRPSYIGSPTWLVPWEWEVLRAVMAPWVSSSPVSVLPIMPQKVEGAEHRSGCVWGEHRTRLTVNLLWDHQAP